MMVMTFQIANIHTKIKLQKNNQMEIVELQNTTTEMKKEKITRGPLVLIWAGRRKN